MTTFKRLFGIEKSHVKKTCILLPLLRKDVLEWLGVKNLSRGKLYGSGNSKFFTVIHTGIGPALLGDAVLYLGQTQCQNIILLGSCGLVKEEKNINIGSLVTPYECYSLESFTEMLLKNQFLWPSGQSLFKIDTERPLLIRTPKGANFWPRMYKKDAEIFHPDKILLENFLKACKRCDIKKVTCATLGSLKLEEDYIETFKEKGIQILDMECAALFCASKYIKIKSMALLYVTDIINKKPFYMGLNPEERKSLSSSIKSAVHILCEFIKMS